MISKRSRRLSCDHWLMGIDRLGALRRGLPDGLWRMYRRFEASILRGVR